jgi:hypothetical protein
LPDHDREQALRLPVLSHDGHDIWLRVLYFPWKTLGSKQFRYLLRDFRPVPNDYARRRFHGQGLLILPVEEESDPFGVGAARMPSVLLARPAPG